jgi:hypothetical protein
MLAAIPQASTLQGVDELRARVESLAEAGVLSAEQVSALNRSLHEAEARLRSAGSAAGDSASELRRFGASLRDLHIDQLSRELANLGKKFREGQITAEELRVATAMVTAEMQRQTDAAREANRENAALTQTNHGLAESYHQVADEAKNAAAAKSGESTRNNRSMPAYIPKNLANKSLEQLQEILKKEESRLGVAWMLSKEEVESRLRPIRDAVRAAEMEQIAAERQMIDLKAKAEELGIRALHRSKEELELLIAKADLESARRDRIATAQPASPSAVGTGRHASAPQTVVHRIEIGQRRVQIETAPGQDAAIAHLLHELEAASARASK